MMGVLCRTLLSPGYRVTCWEAVYLWMYVGFESR